MVVYVHERRRYDETSKNKKKDTEITGRQKDCQETEVKRDGPKERGCFKVRSLCKTLLPRLLLRSPRWVPRTRTKLRSHPVLVRLNVPNRFLVLSGTRS